MTTTTMQRTEVGIDLVQPHPDNVRRRIDGHQLRKLTASIEARGILQPLLVRPDGDRYQVVAGHRRLAAARAAGLTAVPVTVEEMTDGEVEEAMLIENLHHEGLTAVEEARGYLRLVERDMDVKTLAGRIGRSQKHVAGRLRLLELPDPMLDLVDGGELSLSDADDLVALLAEHPWHEQTDEVQTAVLDALTNSGYGSPVRGAANILDRVRREVSAAEVLTKVEAKAAKHDYEVVRYETRDYRQVLPAGCVPLGEEHAELHIEVKAHRSEPCHVLIFDDRYPGKPKVVEGCKQRGRHTASGSSEVKRADLDQVQAEREQARAEREARAHRVEVARQADAAIVTEASKAEQTRLLAAVVVADAGRCADAAVARLDLDLTEDDERGPDQLLADYAGQSTAAAWRAAVAVAAVKADGDWTIQQAVGDQLDELRREVHPAWADLVVDAS